MFFEYPIFLWLLIVPALLLALYIYREIKGKKPHFRVSASSAWLAGNDSSTLRFFRHIPAALRTIALVLIVICIARPRSSSETETVNTEGIDIALAMDVSPSMLAEDFSPNRMEAAKEIAIEFISQRPSDRMSIVVFSGESYTQCPLTTDRATLVNLMSDIQVGLIEDGTAIGNGLATAVARLKDSDAKSKVIILLTDGMNNCGEITPQMAAEMAALYKIKVYTIAMSSGKDKAVVMTPWGPEVQMVTSQIDEDLLKQIASTTGGAFFRATDNTKLAEIYSDINEMEKSKTTVDSFPIYKELYMDFAIWALLCLLAEVLLRLFLRKLP